ncbi:MAG: 2,3-diphosphoglycerate-dependent phosphoglycerate mutase [Bdellovibrionales bacterium]
MAKLVLLRHGESQWNQENRFTGWVDVDLSAKGREEALHAGRLLKEAQYQFDEAHTSILKRAIRTLWITLDELDQMYLPVQRSWRLNERHYGALQGLNKTETAARFGEEQVFIWRRSFDIPPPPLSDEQMTLQLKEPRMASVPKELMPTAEALLHCQKRVMPYWDEVLAPALKKGRTVLVVAHGNSLRSLVKHLDQISDHDIAELNIPTGFPLAYELDQNLRPLKRGYLGDAKAAEAAAAAVAKQGKAKK